MNFTFENIGTSTYLVYAVSPEENIDTLSLGMLTNNKIPGLAPTQFSQMDTSKYIRYNVSAHISVKQFFSGPVNKKRLIGVLRGIINAMISSEDYMLDPNSIVMDPDYIFADVSTCETVMICLPIAGIEHKKTDISTFFKNMVFSTQFDPTENCDYVAKIINYLNSNPQISLYDFKAVIDGIDSDPATVKTQPVVEQRPVRESIPVQPIVQVPQQPANIGQQKVIAQQPAVKKVPQNIPAKNKTEKASAMAIPNSGKMAVPNKKTASEPTSPVGEPDKQISFFYLMQHYNKENAAAYKAQKEAKKAKKEVPASVPIAEKKPAAFSVPGAPKGNIPNPAFNPASNARVNVGTSAQPAKGFAVPGAANQNFNPGPAPSASVTAQSQIQQNFTDAIQPTFQTIPQQSMNFGETTVLGGSSSGETTVLGAEPSASRPRPHLVRTKNNERIYLDKPVFRIGKEKSYVDYFIGDNTAISRSHANIIIRGDEYFVTDTNSTNHTYVNGAMIQSNVETKLSHGDRVRLANEDFEFKLY